LKIRSILGAVILAFSLLFPYVQNTTHALQEEPDPEWEMVAPGIQYRLYTLPTPNRVHVARMDRNAYQATLDTSIAMGRLASGRETVLNMARRYDDVINYWGDTTLDELGNPVREPGWGTRNRVAVAINGFYFNPTTGYPIQGLVQSGAYARRFDDCESGTGGSGFAWGLDRNAFIGESVRHYLSTFTYDSFNKLIGETRTYPQYIIPANPTAPPVQLHGLNRIRGEDEVILYTPQYDIQTYTPITGTEVLVELAGPNMIDPVPLVVEESFESEMGKIITQTVTGTQFTITGTVKGVLPHQGSSLIPFDHVVISAGSLVSGTLTSSFKTGDVINISQTVFGCMGKPNYPWGHTYTSIGGAFYFLQNGIINSFSNRGEANVRDPRTAIAFNADYVYFIVVDGRDPYWSVGMSIGQLAAFARDTLGATHGIAEDGGGSSTMVVNGTVVNNPFCNNVVCRSKVFMPLVERAQPPENQAVEAAAAADPYARLVANGVMMVVVEPALRSEAFIPGQRVYTSSQANVRLGPGLNYAPITSVLGGVNGTVQDHPGGLNGIYAKSIYWWKIKFDNGTEGWVSETLLRAGSTP
jgi:hypothetical protein